MKDLTPDTQELVQAIGFITTSTTWPKATSLDKEGYLKDEITLHLTALEAGALEGALTLMVKTDQFFVNVKGRARPVPITNRILEKLHAVHAIYRKEQGL